MVFNTSTLAHRCRRGASTPARPASAHSPPSPQRSASRSHRSACPYTSGTRIDASRVRGALKLLPGAAVHIEGVTPVTDRFLRRGAGRHNTREVRERDEVSAALVFRERPNLASRKPLICSVELGRRSNFRLLKGPLLPPEGAVMIDDPAPAAGIELQFDLEPTLLTVVDRRGPRRAIGIISVPCDRHAALPRRLQ